MIESAINAVPAQEILAPDVYLNYRLSPRSVSESRFAHKLTSVFFSKEPLMATVRRKSSIRVGKRRSFERKHYNYGRWTKGRFSEAVTVTGPAKMIFLAGIGSEHEQTGRIMHPGDFDAQCRYAFRKLKKVLAKNGARLSDVVKQVTYVTDARYVRQAGERRREAYGEAPLPAHTFVNVSQLAWPDMLVEIDVIAMVDSPVDG